MLKLFHTSICATLLLFTAAASASGLGGVLKDRAIDSVTPKAPSLGLDKGIDALALPGLSTDTAGNAAGVLQYCLKQKYLSGLNAENAKEKLLDKAGLKQTQKDQGYEQGLAGVLMGKGGKSVDFDQLPEKMKGKACDYVLENAVGL